MSKNFNQERLLQVLVAPQISEKATYVADKNDQVVFIVTPDATKPEIKAAVELLFKVEVKSVQVANLKGKRVVLVDDSIVRGNTVHPLLLLLREGGATEVHVRVSSPPIRHPCFMGSRSNVRKAFVCLKPGQEINFTEGGAA